MKGRLTTEAQRQLASKHGTPAVFADAVRRAIGEISVDEAEAGIAKYEREWAAAGKVGMCSHDNFFACANVTHMKDTGQYQADFKVSCHDCGKPFRFIGLPCGMDLNGAAVSIDGTEGRFAIAPKGEVQSVLEGAPQGFTVRGGEGVAIPKLIDELRAGEGSSVTILCENPDGPPNHAVEACGDWTGWKDLRFGADTLLAALMLAAEARRRKEVGR